MGEGWSLHPSTLIGESPRASHALGPRGWFVVRGTGEVAVRQALKASGALRRLPSDVLAELRAAYADPLGNRCLSFLDAVFGPQVALATQQRLRLARVGIVGCGGIGSGAAYLLAGMGTRRFVLVDPDVVEEGNLARQVMYTLDSVGQRKVDELARALSARFRGVSAQRVCAGGLQPRALRLLAGCDYVVCAGDEPPTLGSELRRVLPLAVPLWTCGYALGRSIVRAPKGTSRAAQGAPVDWRSVPGGFAPSSGLQNMEIAAACAWSLTQYCAGQSEPGGRRGPSGYFRDYTGRG